MIGKAAATLAFVWFATSGGAARAETSVPDRLELDRILEEPGAPWSIAKIAQRAAQTVHLVAAADRRIAGAGRRDGVDGAVLPEHARDGADPDRVRPDL